MAAPLSLPDPGVFDDALRPGRMDLSRRLRWRAVAVVVTAALIALAVAGERQWRASVIASIPVPPTPAAGLFDDPVPIEIMVSAGIGQRAPWRTTEAELRESVELWKRMHLEDWDGVPPLLQLEGLDGLLLRYRGILNNPAAWDRMDAFDWDDVPQPVRTVAFRRMVAYWAGFYDVGATFGLPAPLVAETLAAIVMSESWFDHRARSANRDGTIDIGLAQASPFARERLRQLHARGQVDAALSDEDYDNPWMAARFVALWMQLMLNESGGDLDMAVRAYNRGTGDAGDRLGADYLAAVQRRLTRYIRNSGAPPAWDFVSRRSRELIQQERRS